MGSVKPDLPYNERSGKTPFSSRRKLSIVLFCSLIFLTGFALGRFVYSAPSVTGTDASNIVKYCTQVYNGNVPSWARPYIPSGYADPNGTYRVFVCQTR